MKRDVRAAKVAEIWPATRFEQAGGAGGRAEGARILTSANCLNRKGAFESMHP